MLQYLLLLEADFPLWCFQRIPKINVHMKTTKCMPISSFCWLLSYWLLLSLKDTNNEALFLHLEAYCWSLRRIPIILWIPHKIGSKKKRNSILLFSHYSPVTIHCYCSSVTVHDTVHSEFCLFKGGCPLWFGGFSSKVLVLISLPLELAFLEREPTLLLLLLLPCSPLFTTSLVILQTL